MAGLAVCRTKTKFHPAEQAKGKKVRNEEAQEAAKKFAERLLSGGLNPAAEDFNQGEGPSDSKQATSYLPHQAEMCVQSLLQVSFTKLLLYAGQKACRKQDVQFQVDAFIDSHCHALRAIASHLPAITPLAGVSVAAAYIGKCFQVC